MPKKIPSINDARKRPYRHDGRESPSARGYDSTWRKVRLAVLREEPLCRLCKGRGLIVPAEHVDHILALNNGGTSERSNLQPLCVPCHSRKTVMEDGGLGHKRVNH